MRRLAIVALLASHCAAPPAVVDGPSNKVARGAGADPTSPRSGSIAGD